MTSTAIQEPTLTPLTRHALREQSPDWESPAGPTGVCTLPRITEPTYTYRGYGEPHWRAQTCYLVGAARPDERTVVFSCGCQASVPWWTLEPNIGNTSRG